MKRSTDNRVRNDQLALAFGLQTPAERGEYHPLDVFANKLADALADHGFAREDAADILRDHHEVWLDALTRTEWGFNAALRVGCGEEQGLITDRLIYLAVAQAEDGEFRVAAGFPFGEGEADEALSALLSSADLTDIVLVRMIDVLNEVLDSFEENGLLHLIEGGFTRPCSHHEFPEWRAEIERIRQQGADRLKYRERLKVERNRIERETQRQHELA